MNTQDKLVIINFVAISIITIIIVVVMNHLLGNPIIPEETEVSVNFVRIVDINEKDLFRTMGDIQNYPKILPNNYISVKIINQSNNITYSEEEVTESGIKAKLLVRHVIIPYSNHTVEVINGDARGTTISETFDDLGSSTRITTKATMHLRGILAPFGFLNTILNMP